MSQPYSTVVVVVELVVVMTPDVPAESASTPETTPPSVSIQVTSRRYRELASVKAIIYP